MLDKNPSSATTLQSRNEDLLRGTLKLHDDAMGVCIGKKSTAGPNQSGTDHVRTSYDNADGHPHFVVNVMAHYRVV